MKKLFYLKCAVVEVRAQDAHDGADDLPEDVLVLGQQRQQEVDDDLDPLRLPFAADALPFAPLLLLGLLEADVQVGQHVDGHRGVREELQRQSKDNFK